MSTMTPRRTATADEMTNYTVTFTSTSMRGVQTALCTIIEGYSTCDSDTFARLIAVRRGISTTSITILTATPVSA